MLEEYKMAGINDGASLPGEICGELVGDEVAKMFVQLGHELGARRDAVGIESRNVWQLLSASLRLEFLVYRVSRTPSFILLFVISSSFCGI